jgi:hypothetical protein
MMDEIFVACTDEALGSLLIKRAGKPVTVVAFTARGCLDVILQKFAAEKFANDKRICADKQ